MRHATFISALASILLAFWYLAAIVGLDVHVDHHDGEVFVVSLLSRTDCESLHPEDECHCLEHHRGLCHDDDEDCENEISLISITGDGFDFICDFTPLFVALEVIDTPSAPFSTSVCSYSLSVPDDPPRLRLQSYCVLRV